MSIHFKHLKNTNYAEWALCMEAVLIQAGLWSIIQPEISPVNADGSTKDEMTMAAELNAELKKQMLSKKNETYTEIILAIEHASVKQ
ncbi:hypothetical protein CPB84DRAFT_1851569 [Gymnopilus junonius]|uniref:DUF4219 domain-containing protein n=1 Tax=Gymnopilus junonius TaxID=109634 RepID=A0A9P5NE74_GYMJU|nr:hypothetical protein CPB84DRAFT_1851569 [Gymnopilus junonius]